MGFHTIHKSTFQWWLKNVPRDTLTHSHTCCYVHTPLSNSPAAVSGKSDFWQPLFTPTSIHTLFHIWSLFSYYCAIINVTNPPTRSYTFLITLPFLATASSSHFLLDNPARSVFLKHRSNHTSGLTVCTLTTNHTLKNLQWLHTAYWIRYDLKFLSCFGVLVWLSWSSGWVWVS